MRTWLHILYETAWLRAHPMIGPVAPDDPMPAIYPTWRQAYALACDLVRR